VSAQHAAASKTSFFQSAWARKRLAFAVAAAVFAAMLGYATMREPYVATAQLSVGHVVQFSTSGVAVFNLIESPEMVERRLLEETLPKMGLARACSAKARAIERGGPIVLSCKAGTEQEARQRVLAIAERVLASHRARFDPVVQLLNEHTDREKRRLGRVNTIHQRLNGASGTAGARDPGSRKGSEATFQSFMIERELLAVQESIHKLQESVEQGTSVRKLDRMTKLDEGELHVQARPLTPLIIGMALAIALAFGAFVALAAAAVATLLETGYARDSIHER
jgi:hypothetical protein